MKFWLIREGKKWKCYSEYSGLTVEGREILLTAGPYYHRRRKQALLKCLSEITSSQTPLRVGRTKLEKITRQRMNAAGLKPGPEQRTWV